MPWHWLNNSQTDTQTSRLDLLNPLSAGDGYFRLQVSCLYRRSRIIPTPTRGKVLIGATVAQLGPAIHTARGYTPNTQTEPRLHHCVVSRTKTRITGPKSVDDVEPRLCGPIDRNSIEPVSIKVTRDRDISRVAEKERDVRNSLRV